MKVELPLLRGGEGGRFFRDSSLVLFVDRDS